MNTVTFFTPRAVIERELAEELEHQFNAAWFPDYHRWTLDTEDAVVHVDSEPAHLDRMSPDEGRAVAGQLGFVPKGVLHVSGNGVYPGSPALVERVLHALTQHLGGRVLTTQAPLDLPSGSRA